MASTCLTLPMAFAPSSTPSLCLKFPTTVSVQMSQIIHASHASTLEHHILFRLTMQTRKPGVSASFLTNLFPLCHRKRSESWETAKLHEAEHACIVGRNRFSNISHPLAQKHGHVDNDGQFPVCHSLHYLEANEILLRYPHFYTKLLISGGMPSASR